MTSVTICLPRRASIVVALVALACASCATPPASEPTMPPKDANAGQDAQPPKEPAEPPAASLHVPSKSEQELDKGIGSYEDGEYKTSARQLQAAIDLGLDAARDRARAHKYLAFIDCVSGRKKACRDEFNKALDADPKFDLEPAEAGHPIWGPVWRSVKTTRAAKPKAK